MTSSARWFLLVLAAFLSVLCLSAPPASAQTTIWSATLTPISIQAVVGCHNSVGTAAGKCSGALTVDNFEHNGVSYSILQIHVATGSPARLQLGLDNTISDSLKTATLRVGNTDFALSAGTLSANDKVISWRNSGLSWTSGQQVSLSLTAPSQTLSVDATPACGSAVTDTSVQPSYSVVLTPAPAADTDTQYRIVTANAARGWLSGIAILEHGESAQRSTFSFAGMRQAYSGFKGFEFRLTNDHSVTAQCFWTFPPDNGTNSENPEPPPPPPTQPNTHIQIPTTGGGGGPLPVAPSDPAPPSDDSSPRCGASDGENLERFYEASGGEDWHEKENWNSEEPLGQWFGVETDEDGSVISLRLEENNLSGDMPTKELLCLTKLKELALRDNDGLSGEVPEELVLAVERAVLRDIAEMLNLNPQWFENYEEPFDFEDWHEGVTTDDDGRVTELDFTGEDITGEIPESVFELRRLGMISTECGITLEVEAPERVSVMMPDNCAEETAASGGGGCALGSGDPSAFGLFLVTLLVFAVLGRKRAR